MTFGAEADEATSFALMDTYTEAGGNFFDTADVYTTGVAEEIVGRWLKAHPTEARQIVLPPRRGFRWGRGRTISGCRAGTWAWRWTIR
jgi:aryl-alcohol dehydrogenase (NADP+)